MRNGSVLRAEQPQSGRKIQDAVKLGIQTLCILDNCVYKVSSRKQKFSDRDYALLNLHFLLRILYEYP